MNGQLNEHPLPELIRELSLKKLSGRLRLEQDKVKLAIYFKSGELLYAASNVRALRLSECLVKNKFITEDELRHLGTKSDFELARTLTLEKRVSQTQMNQMQAKVVGDILRLSLLWTEGTWEFDNRSHLNEEVTLQLDIPNLLLEASRRLPLKFTASRFKNPSETFAPVPEPPNVTSLLPAEGFLLSRVDSPILLKDLVAISGLRELDTLRVIYSLSLAGVLKRSSWMNAFREGAEETAKPSIKPTPREPKFIETPPPATDSLDTFLDRLSAAESHYEVLGVTERATPSELKSAYYDIARKYHPDRFRSETAMLARIESAFARITQAYDTLRDPGMRATYDSKLDSQARASKVAQTAPKATSKVKSQTPVVEAPAEEFAGPQISPAQQAENQFKEGFAALELGQRNVAIGLLGSAARAYPDDPRYRAYFGRALALHESTRRLAEVELQAAVKLEPKNAEYRIMLAELYRELGFLVRAKGEAERAVAADRNNRKARDLLRSLN